MMNKLITLILSMSVFGGGSALVSNTNDKHYNNVDILSKVFTTSSENTNGQATVQDLKLDNSFDGLIIGSVPSSLAILSGQSTSQCVQNYNEQIAVGSGQVQQKQTDQKQAEQKQPEKPSVEDKKEQQNSQNQQANSGVVQKPQQVEDNKKPIINNVAETAKNQQVPAKVVEPKTEATTAAKPAVTNATGDAFTAQVEQAIFKIVNEERAKAGVAPLTYNGTMEKYARIKSKDMGDRGYFDHTNPEGQYITTQMHNDGVTYQYWGENIAYIGGVGNDANSLATQFMTNWMNSQGHRQNILSSNFTGIGVGIYKIGNTVYATQEFFR